MTSKDTNNILLHELHNYLNLKKNQRTCADTSTSRMENWKVILSLDYLNYHRVPSKTSSCEF